MMSHQQTANILCRNANGIMQRGHELDQFLSENSTDTTQINETHLVFHNQLTSQILQLCCVLVLSPKWKSKRRNNGSCKKSSQTTRLWYVLYSKYTNIGDNSQTS